VFVLCGCSVCAVCFLCSSYVRNACLLCSLSVFVYMCTMCVLASFVKSFTMYVLAMLFYVLTMCVPLRFYVFYHVFVWYKWLFLDLYVLAMFVPCSYCVLPMF
jgi:hypothetical protein